MPLPSTVTAASSCCFGTQGESIKLYSSLPLWMAQWSPGKSTLFVRRDKFPMISTNYDQSLQRSCIWFVLEISNLKFFLNSSLEFFFFHSAMPSIGLDLWEIVTAGTLQQFSQAQGKAWGASNNKGTWKLPANSSSMPSRESWIKLLA